MRLRELWGLIRGRSILRWKDDIVIYKIEEIEIIMKIKNKWFSFNFRFVNFIPISIFIIKATEIFLRTSGIDFLSESTNDFLSNYIQWVGVLYGVTTPLILLKVWEESSNINRYFNKESSTVKLFFGYIIYLPVKYKNEMSYALYKYVKHVIANYQKEVVGLNTEDTKVDYIEEGNQILEEISSILNNLINSTFMKLNTSHLIFPELLQTLKEIKQIREERIISVSDRMFESLKIALLLASCAFLIPLYVIGFTPNTPLLHNFLIALCTLLIILIYIIIEDLSEPFKEPWSIKYTAWESLLNHMSLPKDKVSLKSKKQKPLKDKNA
jgi:hypothetical protein